MGVSGARTIPTRYDKQLGQVSSNFAAAKNGQVSINLLQQKTVKLSVNLLQ